ncbi:hypothetical protein MIND_01167300 [Mycena indigotica]|uniref:F-box domain-containing protein n=1 Tax=Mycena indigotica TaxID=2126181 RepID=A0A8H6S5Y9_9AGAR|nr:uncharacterized protein MIND_01167300 [Mycena indigotica]KAF7292691.1 hypothetical protein MIND_01167300 [Mycena indigotica]
MDSATARQTGHQSRTHSRSPTRKSTSFSPNPSLLASLSSPHRSPPPSPAFSLEAHRAIARLVTRRSDLAALCLVSRAFCRVSQAILYNTVHFNDLKGGALVCETLVANAGLARRVKAMTIQIWARPRRAEQGTAHANAEEEASEEDSESEGASDESRGDDRSEAELETPAEFWALVAKTLVKTINLRHLVVDISSPISTAVEYAWSLGGAECPFRLHTFHCDFDWDANLVAFLETQTELYDLYVRDYRDLALLSSPLSPQEVSPPIALHNNNSPLPALTTLECTFSEAAVLLSPGRPLSRLKTAFSTPPHIANREPEIRLLISALRRSNAPLISLDVGDAPLPGATAEAETASMQLLQRVAHARAMTMARELRYFGTLILPVGGRKRLQFYGILIRLSALRCVELDVTSWKPPPSSSPALRALAAELRLYCKDITTIVFVHGEDLQRTIVAVDAVTGVLKVDRSAMPDHLWREI